MALRLADFDFLDDSKILGSGAYSKVYNVRYKRDNKVYAIKKVLSKDKPIPTVKA